MANLLLVFTTLFFQKTLFASDLNRDQIPFSDKHIQQVEETFFENKQVSRKKIERYESEIAKAQKELFNLLLNYNKVYKDLEEDKAKKKVYRESLIRGYAFLRELLGGMSEVSYEDGIKMGSQVLNLAYSLKSNGKRYPWQEVLGYAKGFVKDYKVKYRNQNQREASNLINKKRGSYYSQKKLMSLKASGFDLSKLNPIGDGIYWTDTDIENYRINHTFNMGSQLYKNSKIIFPDDGASFEIDKVKRSDSRPKFNVTKYIDGKRKKFKLKILSETHSEPIAAALAAAIGYNTDASKHIKRPKVYFNKISRQLFFRQIEEYYGYWNYAHTILEEGEDSGGKYVVFNEAILEAKISNHNRLEGWPFNENAQPDLREVRGLSLFMAWINNNDLKEADQNKLILKGKKGSERLFYLNSDLGWSFGIFAQSELPQFFKSNPIKSTKGDGIKFNYMTWHWSNLFDDITYDDARWLARRIARLSRDQIKDAVKLGRMSSSASATLVEKLSKRRNRIVEAFNLQEEFLPLPEYEVDETGNEKRDIGLKGFNGLIYNLDYELINFIMPAIWNFGYEQTKSVLDSRIIQPLRTELRFRGDNFFGLGKPFSNGLILRVNRTISKDKEPDGMKEKYLVHDEFVIGWELGGSLLYADAGMTYFRSYNLIYPSDNNGKAYFNPNYLGNMLLPYNIGYAKLPPKYSMFVQDSLEGKGVLRTNSTKIIDLGTKAELKKVVLKRILISDKDRNEINILEDRSQYTELSARIQASLLMFDFPLFKGALRGGRIDRNFWKVPSKEKNSNRRFNEAFGKLILTLNIDPINAFTEKNKIKSNYKETGYGFNLFDIVKAKREYRKDKISEYQGRDDKWKNDKLQITTLKEEEWGSKYVFEVKERKSARTFFTAIKNEKGELVDTILGLNINMIDNITTKKELKNEHVKLANDAAGDDQFITFHPHLHNNNDRWGFVETQIDILFYQEGIENILNSTNKDIDNAYHKMIGFAAHDIREQQPLRKDFLKIKRSIIKARNISNIQKRADYLVKMVKNSVVATSFTSG